MDLASVTEALVRGSAPGRLVGALFDWAVICDSLSILDVGYGQSFFFSSRRRHTRLQGDWSSDVCSSDLPNARQRRDARRLERIEPEDVARLRRVDHWARLARSGLEGPHAHVRYRGRAERHPLPFYELRRVGEREVEAVGGAVQPSAVVLVRGQAVQRVRARIHRVQMRTLKGDRNEDVTHPYRIALHGVDPDEVKPKLAEHRLAERPRRQTAHGGGERRDETGPAALRPPQIPATRTRSRVGGLPFRDVVELGLASRDLIPQGARMRAGRRAVGGARDARQLDVAEPGRRGSLEIVPVHAVVALTGT